MSLPTLILVVLLVALASPTFAGAVKGRALVVGVNDYTDTMITKLTCSVPDAKLIAGLLADPARGVFGDGQVRVLTDDDPSPDHKPTRLNILEGVQWLSEAGADETVVLYFSGHGCVDGGRQYIASQDTKLSSLRFTAVPVDDINSVLDDLAKTKARRIVVIFDSCHSGVRRGAKAMDSESGAVMEGLMNDAEGKVTLASCNADEYSFEDETKGHGVFTYFLSEGLKGAADANSDGLVSVGELHVYVRKKVSEWAKANGRTQTPRVQSNMSGDIILARDPAKYADSVKAASARKADLIDLRSKVLLRIGSAADQISSADGAVLLRALDDEVAGGASPAATKLEDVARRMCSGALGVQAASAEIKAVGGVPAAGGVVAPSAPINVQLFQPAWEAGASPDDYTVRCASGDTIKVVGLATSTAGVTQVLVDGDIVKSRSLGSKEIILVRANPAATAVADPAPALSDMRFEGTIRAGSEPSTVVVTIVDSTGARRLIQLHLKPSGPAMGATAVAAHPAIAVVGLGHAQVDDYQELRTSRIGQGFHNVLTNAARDASKFTLVEEKTDVLKGLVDRQWLQKSAAFDQAAAVQTGKLMGAKYVLYGEVYDFASPKENRGKLFLQVEVRLVNVETGVYVPGYGKAEQVVPKGEPGDAQFDRSTLAAVSDKAIRAALVDALSRVNLQ
ncbi:MAG TPA: caspase family protein [Capsulimonadaceae bacterium]